MIVNLDVDVYAKTPKHSATLKKTTTYWKPNEYQIPKYKLSGDPAFTFGLFAPLLRRQLRY